MRTHRLSATSPLAAVAVTLGIACGPPPQTLPIEVGLERQIEQPSPAPNVYSWVGQDSVTLLREVGAPAREIELPKGGHVYTYSNRRLHVQATNVETTTALSVAQGSKQTIATTSKRAPLSAAAQVALNQSQAHAKTVVSGGGTNESVCETHFEISADGRVVGVNQTGDSCVTLSVAAPQADVAAWEASLADLEERIVPVMGQLHCQGKWYTVTWIAARHSLRSVYNSSYAWKIVDADERAQVFFASEKEEAFQVRICTDSDNHKYAVTEWGQGFMVK